MSVLEIQKRLKSLDQSLYSIWGGPLNITTGIASGSANVGFYGDKAFIRQYSAVGEPVVLAQRLSSHCKPNDILVSSTVQESIHRSFEIKHFDHITPKGFDTFLNVYKLIAAKSSQEHTDMLCESCGSTNVYLVNNRGIYDLACRDCEADEEVKQAS